MRRLSSVSVTVGAVLTAGIALAGCSADEPDHTEICVDSQTMERVPDERCEQHSLSSSTFLWYYLGRSFAAPPVGSKVTSGSFTKPTTGTVGRVPSSGGFGTFKGSTGS